MTTQSLLPLDSAMMLAIRSRSSLEVTDEDCRFNHRSYGQQTVGLQKLAALSRQAVGFAGSVTYD